MTDWHLTLWLEPVMRCYRFRIERGPEREVCAEVTCVDGTTRPMAKQAMWEFWKQLRSFTGTH
jgi:hypothetical protein